MAHVLHAVARYLPSHSEDIRARVEKMWMQQLGVQVSCLVNLSSADARGTSECLGHLGA